MASEDSSGERWIEFVRDVLPVGRKQTCVSIGSPFCNLRPVSFLAKNVDEQPVGQSLYSVAKSRRGASRSLVHSFVESQSRS